MNEIKIDFGVDRTALAWQVASLILILLAGAATVIALKKRKELNFGILPTLLIIWFVPLVGPVCVIWGLQEPKIKKTT